MERNLISKVITASKNLDDLGLYKEADIVTLIMNRISQSDMGVLGQGVKQTTDNVQLKPESGYGANPIGSISANAGGDIPDSPVEIPTPKPGETPDAFRQRVQSVMQSPEMKQRMQAGDQQQRSQNSQFEMNILNQKLQQIGTQLQNAPAGPQKQALQQQYNAMQQSVSSVGQMLNQSFNNQSVSTDPSASISSTSLPSAGQAKTIDYNKLSKMRGM